MFSILLHSSKTMRPAIVDSTMPYQKPALSAHTSQLIDYLQQLHLDDIQRLMKISKAKAEQTKHLIDTWSDNPQHQRPAIDAFLGDIYSGLQVHSFTQAHRDYANKHLYILSGLYGVLRALDSISPYRLEMGYPIAPPPHKNLYEFWADAIALQIPDGDIINVSSAEYTKALLPYISALRRIVCPKFMTISPKTGEPTFVTVHAKIARGAFAHWLITHDIQSLDRLTDFDELGYAYDASLSTPDEPVFVCPTFGGIGLSVRLS